MTDLEQELLNKFDELVIRGNAKSRESKLEKAMLAINLSHFIASYALTKSLHMANVKPGTSTYEQAVNAYLRDMKALIDSGWEFTMVQ